MGKTWRIQPHDSLRVERLQRAADIPAVVAQLLLGRGIDSPEAARAFLDPKLSGLREPQLLPGVTEATDRLFAAVRDRRRIVVYGDYDADGMTAAAMLYRCLKLLGGEVGYFVPNRLEEGYGLNHDSLRQLAERGAQLVVTVDCGITSVAQAETARELGLELVITDHHEPAEQLPRAAAIVHPRLNGGSYPFAGLCGAGVALKLAWALCQRASDSQRVSEPLRVFLLQAVGLAALGTVADVVPLVDENRVLVRHGLSCLRAHPVTGLVALMKTAGLDKKPSLGGEDIAFTLAPRLNAAGRLGQAQLGVELLTTESPERAAALADYIHELNNSRDSLERSVYLAAKKQLDEQFDPETDPALVLSGRGWHPGVIGLVAGRLAEKHNRPAVIIALDATGTKPGTGSARTAGGVELNRALAACSEHLLAHGGHAAAAGLQIEEGSLAAFRAALFEYLEAEAPASRGPAELRIDAEAPFSQLTFRTVSQLEQLAPFGAGNPRPVLCASAVSLAAQPKRMGSGERHLSLLLKQGGASLRAVGFGMGEIAEELAQNQGPIDVAYRPVINDFRGQQNVEVHLVDWRPARNLVSTG